MSYNLTIDNTYAYEIAALTAAIKPLISAWQLATTEEKQASIEAQVVRDIDSYLKRNPNDFKISAGATVSKEDFERFWNTYEKYLVQLLAKLEVLSQKYLNYANAQNIALASLKADILKLNQKTAALRLWNNEEVRYALSEYFVNTDLIDKKTTLEVHTEAGVGTLPVLKKNILTPSEIVIARGSVGKAGNSNRSIEQNQSLADLFTDSNNVFYFENLNSNEVKLRLRISLGSLQILNGLKIVANGNGYGTQPYVSDILFGVEDVPVSLKSLSSLFKDHQSFSNNIFEILFPPIATTTVFIEIVQKGFEFINVVDGNRSLQVKQSLLGLEQIQLIQQIYGDSAEFHSLQQRIPAGLFVSEADLKGDFVSDLQSFNYQIDTGAGWIPAEDGATHLLDGVSTSFAYKLSIKKNTNPEAYNGLSFSNKILEDVQTVTKLVGSSSPIVFSLPECRTEPFVYVPYQLRRGPSRKKLFLTKAFATNQRHQIPFDLVSLGLEPTQLKLFVNGVQLSYVFSGPSATQFSFNEELDSIILSSSLTEGSAIEIVLQEEDLVLEQKADGVYAKFKTFFDPDKQTIEIKYLPANLSSRDMFLPRDKRVIYLPDQYIDSNSVVVKKQDGTILESEGSLDSVTALDEFYIDTKNGIVYLDTVTGDDTWSISYRHRSPKMLSEKDYIVIFENGVPWGIRINNSNFVCFTNSEVFNDSIVPDINPLTGLTTTRTSVFSTSQNKKVLSYKNVLTHSLVLSENAFGLYGKPEEIAFIDGETEFLGLLSLEETTVAIEETSGYVEFTLGAGGLWYQDFGLLEADTDWFSNLVANRASVLSGSAGDYYISSSGVVTVKTGAGTDLPAGLILRYYYKDPQFNPNNKYSVDYLNGTVYSHTAFTSSTNFTYKVASYLASYDVVKQLTAFEWNKESKELSVNLDLASKTKFIKAAWQNSFSSNDQKNLKDYYSPIIDQIGIRFY